MAGITVIQVTLPRVVVGTVRGGRRGVESHGVYERCPVGVVTATAAEAPVVARLRHNDFKAAGSPWLLHGDGTYKPLGWDCGGSRDPMAGMHPRELDRRIVPHLREMMHLKVDAEGIKGDRLVNWGRHLHGLKENGLVPAADKSFRDVQDDGRARQAALAEELARDLLMVDGGLYVRAPLPRLGVVASAHKHVAPEVRLRSGAVSRSPYFEALADWNAFPLTDLDAAADYARVLAADVGGKFDGAHTDGFDVVEPGLLAAAYDRSPETRAAAMAAEAARLSHRLIPEFEDEAVYAWTRLRAAGRHGRVDPAAVTADIALMAEAGGPGDDLLGFEGQADDAVTLGRTCRRMLHLWRHVVEPAHVPDDEAAMSGLAP